MRGALIAQGAEARIWKTSKNGRGVVLKERKQKSYRNPALDDRIRGARTRAEIRQLNRAREIGLVVPKVIESDEKNHRFWMEKIDGKPLDQVLRPANARKWLSRIAGDLAKLHANQLCHGDVTSTNLLVVGKEIVWIDFGLSFHSARVEDYAVDVLNFKKTLLARHPKLETAWPAFERAYANALENGKAVLAQLQKVEKRVRYR